MKKTININKMFIIKKYLNIFPPHVQRKEYLNIIIQSYINTIRVGLMIIWLGWSVLFFLWILTPMSDYIEIKGNILRI